MDDFIEHFIASKLKVNEQFLNYETQCMYNTV